MKNDNNNEKSTRKIIFATGNQGKLQEIEMILADTPFIVLSLKDIAFTGEIVEDGTTFEENAIIKAKTIAAMTGEIVLADDSGLVIDYLNGEPGIYSARYLGENTSYKIKNAKLIERLTNVRDEERTARFVCAIAAAFPNGEVLTKSACIEGRIGYEERGDGGFGYDPIFFVPEYNCTTAQLSAEQKNLISHRGKALRDMKEILLKRIQIGDIDEDINNK